MNLLTDCLNERPVILKTKEAQIEVLRSET